MPGKNIHTTYNSAVKNWCNVTEGTKRPEKVYLTKNGALGAGRQAAKNRRVEHLVHNRDGKISARNSYGHDPETRKG